MPLRVLELSTAPMVTACPALVMMPTPKDSVVPATSVTVVEAPVCAMRQEFAAFAPVVRVGVRAVVPLPA